MDTTPNSGQSIFSVVFVFSKLIVRGKKSRLFHIFPSVFDHLLILHGPNIYKDTKP
jgi:hypothetical protein